MSTFTYLLVIKELTLIWAYLTLALFCIKRLICRGFSTSVEEKTENRRQKNDDKYLLHKELSGSL